MLRASQIMTNTRQITIEGSQEYVQRVEQKTNTFYSITDNTLGLIAKGCDLVKAATMIAEEKLAGIVLKDGLMDGDKVTTNVAVIKATVRERRSNKTYIFNRTNNIARRSRGEMLVSKYNLEERKHYTITEIEDLQECVIVNYVSKDGKNAFAKVYQGDGLDVFKSLDLIAGDTVRLNKRNNSIAKVIIKDDESTKTNK